MAEYIEREAAIAMIRENGVCGSGWSDQEREDDVVDMIESIPAADVRPVVKGKWIDHQECRWIYAKCSECGTVHDVKSNFCPNCGADMRPEPPKEET